MSGPGCRYIYKESPNLRWMTDNYVRYSPAVDIDTNYALDTE